MNTLGHAFRVTSFGESHGPYVGAVVDGCPAGLNLDVQAIQHQLDRRKPGQSALTTQRKETDNVEVASGVYQGKTTGAPILLLIRNENARPQDYDHLETAFRPGHADLTYHLKYGHRDPRGGGRSSARITAGWVAAGAIARQMLLSGWPAFSLKAWVQQVADVHMPHDHWPFSLADIESQPTRCPHPSAAEAMEARIREARKTGDTLGGIVAAEVVGVPPGVGRPVFQKLHAQLGHAVLSINACKGFEMGEGFGAAAMFGSEHNDPIGHSDDAFHTRSNHAGGVLGGISTGMPLWFRVAFKPVATLMQTAQTVNTAGQPIEMEGRGRHDPCVLPRAVPVVEAMACLALADLALADGVTSGRFGRF